MNTPRERLHDYRVDRELTFRELAKQLGCSPAMVVQLESGKRLPGRDLSLAIAQVVGIDPGDWGAKVHSLSISSNKSPGRGQSNDTNP